MPTMSTVMAYFGQLGGVIVGWLLHELSDLIRLNREDRRVAGQVLVELLELRHSIRVIPLLITELRTRTSLPPEVEPPLRGLLNSLVDEMIKDLPERYNKAVDSIAGRFPLLAFELRSKETFKSYVSQLRALVPKDPAAAAQFSAVEDNISQMVLPVLDKLVLRMAWLHDWRTWFHLRWRVSQSVELPAHVIESINSLVKSAGLQIPPQPEQRP